MAVAFVNKTSTVLNTSGTTTVVSTPSGIAAGQILVAFVGSLAVGTTLSSPAGSTWIKLAEFAPNANLRTALYYRVVTGSEAGTYTWTWSISGRNFGYIVAYSGVDTSVAPPYASLAGLDDTVGPHAAPSVTVGNGGWLWTGAASRQSPGTAGAVTWTINDGADTERFDLTAQNTSTGAQLPSAVYDSNRALTASTGSPTSAPAPLNKYNALWAGSGGMRVGVTVKIGEIPAWQNRFNGLDWMRIFPNSDGLPPDWDDARFGFVQDFAGEPFISSKVDGDTAKLADLKAFLEATPGWVSRVWVTDRHEPEGDVTPTAYKANMNKFFDMIATLSAPIRAKVWDGHVQTRQWTENTSGRSYLTHDTGRGRFWGVDMYMNSYKSGNTAATEFVNATTFLSRFKSYKFTYPNGALDTRARVMPELGAIGIPDDADGTGRAAWMQGLQDQLVTWSEAAQGWPFLGWIWWGTEGKSGTSVLRIGTRRWFNLDRRHNSTPYTYTSGGSTVTDPIGGYELLPNQSTGGGGGGGSVPTARQVTSSVQTAVTHVWSLALNAASAPAAGGNPWTQAGPVPIR